MLFPYCFFHFMHPKFCRKCFTLTATVFCFFPCKRIWNSSECYWDWITVSVISFFRDCGHRSSINWSQNITNTSLIDSFDVLIEQKTLILRNISKLTRSVRILLPKSKYFSISEGEPGFRLNCQTQPFLTWINTLIKALLMKLFW